MEGRTLTDRMGNEYAVNSCFDGVHVCNECCMSAMNANIQEADRTVVSYGCNECMSALVITTHWDMSANESCMSAMEYECMSALVDAGILREL
jgi:hypothetical protein